MTTEEKIKSFLDLPTKEDNHSKRWSDALTRPSQSVINYALNILAVGINTGLITNDAFPGIDGEIMLTFYWNCFCLEFEIHNNSISYRLEEKDETITYEDNITLTEAILILKVFKIFDMKD